MSEVLGKVDEENPMEKQGNTSLARLRERT